MMLREQVVAWWGGAGCRQKCARVRGGFPRYSNTSIHFLKSPEWFNQVHSFIDKFEGSIKVKDQ
jgi:predicted N-acyltransferase